MANVYDYTVRTIDGEAQSLSEFRGRPLLIVNVASRCGFTPQYRGLEALQSRYGPRGLAVLGFPCDQFGHQEPGDESHIRAFCSFNYAVTFPMYAKIEVNGAHADPLYAYLKAAAPGLLGSTGIKWNFTKFLVDRRGTAVCRHAPTSKPETLAPEMRALL